MEQTDNTVEMLELLQRPAFLVKDNIITQTNYAADRRLLVPGTSLSQLLMTGQQEYADFSGGCLYLTLIVQGIPCGATVTRAKDFDIFVLEQESDQTELEAMALAARELRQPLSSVMTVADRLFPMTATNEDPAVQEQVARINRGLFQMLRIVSNMSDAYRYNQEQSHRFELRDICDYLGEIFSKSAELINHAGITLEYSIPSETIFTLIHAEKLERAVNNILSNAVKFTPKGGKILVRLTRRNKMLYLTVEDNGDGIPEKLRKNVYSRFNREPVLEDSRYGIGLGMVLIRSAASEHGGTVLMEYPKEGGTRITMTLAISQNRDAQVRSRILSIDYAGERDHQLIEFSESLPVHLYEEKKIN